MEIPIFIEPIASKGFRARTGEPLGLCAEGVSKEEALGNLQILLSKRLQNGAELTTLSIGPPPHPFQNFKAIFKPDDPMVQEWLQIIEENRRKDDEQEGIER